MAIAFTYKATKNKFSTGNSFKSLTAVILEGPDGVRACAYSANMHLDADGEPQMYANPSKGLKPGENLYNGGYKNASMNSAMKSAFDAAEKKYNDLIQKKKDLLAPPKPAAPPASGTPAAPPDAKALKDLDKEIEQSLHALNVAAGMAVKWGKSWNWDGKGAKPKNWGTVFWHWYGPYALREDEAKRLSFTERLGNGQTAQRKPELEQDKSYEDVYGRLPVVQQNYEPGPKYYVSIVHRRNEAFPVWDQRSGLPAGSTQMVPFAALSSGLTRDASLQLQDQVLAIRLDNGQSLTFPFLDSGNGYKVAEVGLRAFEGVGGVLNKNNINASDNRFMLLYLAFNKSAGQDLWWPLQSFAKAPNAHDFPVLLAFIASATTKARKNNSGLVSVNVNPIQEFEKWKKAGSTQMPDHYDVIKAALEKMGFDPPIVQFVNRNPHLNPQGPQLQPPDGVNPVPHRPTAPYPGKGPEGPFLKPPQAPWK